ncbi:MAG: DNA-binding transcriptional LysR family regulator [Paracoccaceae bacterium]|jgi:DNA-binding transcriptional LysR family regulator
MLYLTLRQYQYVVAVADAGSLTNAAAILHVSQPSLSVAISRVEARLENKVFIRRKGAAISITPFGHRLVEQARELLQSASAIEQRSDTARPFVIGCFEDIAPWYLTKALTALRTQFPDMTFQGREGRFSDLAADISEGRVDLALSYDIGFDGNFNRQKVKQVAPVAFVSTGHPLAKLPSIELHHLKDHPLILSSEELSLGYIRQLFDEFDLIPNVQQKTASLEMMRSFAAHGAGVGISYSKPPTDLSYDGQPLVSIPIRTPEALTDIVLIWTNLVKPDAKTQQILELMASI